MARWSASRCFDGNFAVRLEGDYDAASKELLLAVFHEDTLEESAWRWRLAGGEVAEVAPGGGTARLPSASLPRGEAVLEPKGCLPRWWAQGEEMRLPLEPPA